ncbi:hypothetical protein [Gilvimarinus xylanilyticus]|uniref:Uncharacterized protein n=1 Tax=Gilvimarinus xylanilyticus TaxID=2944139 RepID=A0A9X2KTW5_9GAMM|nr:hypothetical protein [Gilvimarinus xylanilyticus]MCP8899714.1 hypothetical protein [Gilvimarinus xylanilyticus]
MIVLWFSGVVLSNMWMSLNPLQSVKYMGVLESGCQPGPSLRPLSLPETGTFAKYELSASLDELIAFLFMCLLAYKSHLFSALGKMVTDWNAQMPCKTES